MLSLHTLARASRPLASLVRPTLARSLATATPAAVAAELPPVTVTVTADGIAVVRLDAPGEKVNTLSAKLMASFGGVLDQLSNDPKIRAAVLISGKPDGFIAGADITMLSACKSAAELTALSHAGQLMMDRLAACKRPVVAAINGPCMGGGLEVALACKYRIATSSPKTVLSVPEVKLGLLPGAGGTQRLPKLVGIQQALTMATAGGSVRPDKALKTGLVDEVVDPFALEHSAMLAARELADGKLKPKVRKVGLMEKLLEGNPIGRHVLFKKAREMIVKQAGKNYPAPYAILDCIEAGTNSSDAGYKLEREQFGTLGMTPQSEALRGIFFAQTETKRNPFGKAKRDVQTVGVLGAGLMGAGIGQVSVEAGYRVLLKDEQQQGLSRGEAQIKANLDPKVTKRKMTAFARDTLLSRVTGLTPENPNWTKHFGNADIVIEAVPENLALKHKVIQQLEPFLKPTCVFATNTSALPIADIAKASSRPENVVGMHYFSPVDKMPLLEVITHPGTSAETAGTAVAVGYKQGKTVIVVKDVPGFFVNRSLGPFSAESVALLQAGVDPIVLDKALRAFGFPVGPITLNDEVGADVAYHVATFLSKHLDNRMQGANLDALKALIDAGFLGRKAGKGFYSYKDGKSTKQLHPEAMAIVAKFQTSDSGKSLSPEQLANRMVCRFVNEAVRCLQDGIVRSPGDGDIGAVFGIGFPPNRGGPFRYVDQTGVGKVVDDMSRYADTLGPWFAPPQMLVDMAKSGKKFYN